MSIRTVSSLIVGMSALMTGCADPDGTSVLTDEAPVDQGAAPLRPRTISPIGVNGLAPADFWAAASRAAFRALGGAALLGGGDVLAATPLLDTDGGRSVLDYTIRCALPADQVVRSPDGEEFYGEFGFAPAWTGRALTPSEQRWVSACMFQHLNGAEAHVDILLKGGHSALEFPPDEPSFADFVVRDATMYGNAFLPGAVVGFACIDPDLSGALSSVLSLSCPLDLRLLELKRLCGTVPTCGIAFLGLCDLVCAGDAAGNQACYTLPLLGPLLGPSYPETIRTELRDSDLLPLYGGCGLL